MYNIDYRLPDLINQLPNAALRRIFQSLPIVDKIRIQRVCKRWRTISKTAWCTTTYLALNDGTWGFRDPDDELCITSDIVKQVLNYCGPYLTDFHIRYWLVNDHPAPFFTDPGSSAILETVAVSCLRLRRITIENLNVTCASFKSFALASHNLESITIAGQMGKPGMMIELLKNKKLQYLHIKNNRTFSVKCLSYLNPLTLHTLRIEYCPAFKLSIQCLKYNNILLRFRNLAVFELNGQKWSTDMYCIPRSCLRQLTLRNARVNNIKVLHTASELQYLHLSDTCRIDDKFLVLISKHCRKLRYFHLENCAYVSDEGASRIFELPLLESCAFKNVQKLSYHLLEDLYMPQLKRFILDNSIVSCYGFSIERMIARSPRLQYISLINCGIYGDAAVDFIHRTRDAIKWRKTRLNLCIVLAPRQLSKLIILPLKYGAELHIFATPELEELLNHRVESDDSGELITEDCSSRSRVVNGRFLSINKI